MSKLVERLIDAGRVQKNQKKTWITLEIGRFTYDASKIIEVSITFGKQGASVEAAVPSATVKIYGAVPLETYGATSRIRTVHAGLRFTGRVAQMKVEETSKQRQVITTLTLVSQTVRLFRSNNRFHFTPNIGVEGMIERLATESRTLKLPDLSIGSWGSVPGRIADSSELWSTGEITEFLTKIAFSPLHLRSGALVFMSPQWRNETVVKAARESRPILKRHVLDGVEYAQDIAYIDKRILADVLLSADNPDNPDRVQKVRTFDWTKNYLPPGVPEPVQTHTVDLTKFVFTTNDWRFALRMATFQNLYLSLQIDGITVDMARLVQGAMTSTYDAAMLQDMMRLEEGENVVLDNTFGRVAGVKCVQGFTETYTTHSWTLALNLADPRTVFGFSDWWTSLPQQRAFNWNQFTTLWSYQTKTWRESINGITQP